MVTFFKKYGNLISLIIFIIITSILAFHHEPWRDELQAFYIARDCISIKDFLYIMSFEGSPFLWHILLMPFAKLGISFSVIRFLYLLLSWISAYIFIYKVKLTTLVKYLFLFSYFFIYEYTIIVRSYGLSLFFFVLILYFYRERHEHAVKYITILSLFALTNIHSTILFVFYIVMFILEEFKNNKKNAIKIAIYTLILLVLIYLTVKPNSELSGHIADTDNLFDFIYSIFTIITNAILTKILFVNNMWALYFLPNLAIIMIFLIISCLVCIQSKNSIFYILSQFTLLFFLGYKYSGALRHWGFLILNILFFYNMILIEKENANKNINFKLLNIFLVFVFGIHLLGGITVGVGEILLPFSNAHLAAEFIDENISEDILLSYPSDTTTSIIFNSKKIDKMYSIRKKEFVTYTTWDKNCYLYFEKEVEKFNEDLSEVLNKSKNTDVYIVTFDIVYKENLSTMLDDLGIKYEVVFEPENHSLSGESYTIVKILK